MSTRKETIMICDACKREASAGDGWVGGEPLPGWFKVVEHVEPTPPPGLRRWTVWDVCSKECLADLVFEKDGRDIAQRNHHVELNSSQREALLRWLQRPNGSLCDHPSVTFDAVQGGGVLIRTRPYTNRPYNTKT